MNMLGCTHLDLKMLKVRVEKMCKKLIDKKGQHYYKKRFLLTKVKCVKS